MTQSRTPVSPPQHPLRIPAHGSAGEDERDGKEVERRDTKDRAHLGNRRTADEHAAVEQDDNQVADAERESVAVVRIRDRERDHEEAAHASDKQQPEAQPVRRDRVRQPRIAVVHPPNQEQHHDDLHEC